MQFPNRIQSVLLFDRPIEVLEAVVRDFARIEEMKTGATFNVPETKPDRFYRLFNGDEELMLTFEYIDGPANSEAFRAALGSPITGMLCSDIRERIARTGSHILLEVSHGVIGGAAENPEVVQLLQTIGRGPDGATQEQFERRLDVLALMSRIVTDHAAPMAVHWTQSDQLIPGEEFDAFAERPAPDALHVHPYLFGPKPAPGEEGMVGIRTFGARHWLGREILVEPSNLPWAANFETVLAFIRASTAENGYVIPDSDTFGPEDHSFSYKVDWRDADPEEGEHGVPFYQLTPLKHAAHGFVSDQHVPEENVIDLAACPAELMPEDQDEKSSLANEWTEKSRMAEAAGGRFEVRAVGGGIVSPPSPETPTRIVEPTPAHPELPTVSGRGLRAKVFGRKEG